MNEQVLLAASRFRYEFPCESLYTFEGQNTQRLARRLRSTALGFCVDLRVSFDVDFDVDFYTLVCTHSYGP